MPNPTQKIVITGGGTAGWITAGLLAAEARNAPERQLEIVLIESPDIPTIGVGEGTWPSMRMTLQKIGLPELELLRACDASFKQGTQFVGWAQEGDEQHYFHPFSLPAEYSSLNLAEFWLDHDTNLSFTDFVTPQGKVIAAGLAPKQAATPEYAFNVNYGYHFDAGKFAEALHRHAVGSLGVTYISGNVEQVEAADNGDIAALVLTTGDRVAGDLFVDCTGQRAMLIGEHYGVPFRSVKRYLFNDAAIAVQVPHASAEAPIASVTRATAVDAGWIWDIALQSRRGLGHVYSTAHADEQQAMSTLQQYVRQTSPGCNVDELMFRSIPFEPGYRQQFWVNNCVAVGLSGGFIEPLEASALALIEQAASMISRQLPVNRDIMTVVARRFNEKMAYNWTRVIEFLKLHYVISQRSDSQYWLDCRDESSCPEGLRDKLLLWQQQAPWHDDAPRVDELFPSASYQYVLFGMGFKPEFRVRADKVSDAVRDRIEKVLHTNNEKARQMVSALPTNRELLQALTALPGVA